jgi:hypothetical protein
MIYFINQIKTSSKEQKKIITYSTGEFQLYNSVTKINSEAGLLTNAVGITNVFNRFFIQIAENLNNK